MATSTAQVQLHSRHRAEPCCCIIICSHVKQLTLLFCSISCSLSCFLLTRRQGIGHWDPAHCGSNYQDAACQSTKQFPERHIATLVHWAEAECTSWSYTHSHLQSLLRFEKQLMTLYEPHTFKQTMRMHMDTCEMLCDELRPHMERETTNLKQPVAVDQTTNI